MQKYFKYRIYPTKKQTRLLNETLEECRWLYNYLLEQCRDAYEHEEQIPSCFGQQRTYTTLKEQRPSLNIAHSQVLQNVAIRIDLVFKAFLRRCKHGEKPGLLKFQMAARSKTASFSSPRLGMSRLNSIVRWVGLPSPVRFPVAPQASGMPVS